MEGSGESKPMRLKMPVVTAFLDDLREAFGRDVIDNAIRRGMKGEPTFFAQEGGVELGTRIIDQRKE